MTKQELVDKVLKQIKKDIENGDVSAIDEMLLSVDEESLKAYLPEE